MYSSIEGTMCANCSHRDVCSLKDQFIAAQKAVDEVSVNLGCDGNKMSFKRLRDFNWIKRVKLECTNFIEKRTVRETHSIPAISDGICIRRMEGQE